MQKRISCIIPAYNEAPRIGAVLQVVCAHPDLAEVIVVDDASTDGTADVVMTHPGAMLIRQPRNMGKSAAIACGIAAAQHECLMFLDADLIGLDGNALTALAAPVLNGTARAAISLRGNSPAPWRLIGLDYISGERVMTRDLLPPQAEIAALPRFGLEVAMNRVWVAAGARIDVVPWPRVASPMKAAKHGPWRGIWADIGMLCDIARTVGLWRAGWQIWRMRRMARQSA